MSLSVSRTDQQDHTTLLIGGNLDISTADQLTEVREKLLNDRRMMVVADLSALRLLDGEGVGALVAIYKAIRQAGGEFKVVGAHAQPLGVLKLLRMDRVFVV